ncbi:MAG: GGDEF domain-containing protein [Gammaproteobacteria bacterium]|nr:GGDEF domain-containing protein [Gammaproteobacteria bacterium]
MDQPLEICPVGEPDCQWLQELAQLKRDVEELKLQAIIDPLTGLFNYRHFQQVLDTEMQRTVRTSHPTSLVLIDLDHFKAVNDKWGHEAGNQALKTSARLFQQQLRQFDIVCRYGGEEFAVILPHTPLPIAFNVAERLRKQLAQVSIEVDEGQFSLTASFGVAEFQPDSQYNQTLLINQADQVLYQAKQQGRDQVCAAERLLSQADTAVSSDEKSELLGGSTSKD